jgi:uncharacterized protein (DUF885 family)
MPVRPIFVFAAVLLVPAACAPPAATVPVTPMPAAAASPAATVKAIADEYVREFYRANPDAATTAGYPDADHGRLRDNSLAAIEEWRMLEDGWLARAAEIDASRLAGTPEQRTYAALTERLAASRDLRVCRYELWPSSPTYTGWQAVYPFLATVQPVGDPALRDATLRRWRQLPGYLDTEVANMRIGMQQGYVSPRTGVESVIRQLDALLATPVDDTPWMNPASRDTAAPPDFRAAVREIIETQITPAVRRYRDFLAIDYLPRARETIAVTDSPGGEACYRASLRSFTTLQPSPREVHETGLREMAPIRAEMQEIAQRSFGTSDVRAVLEMLRTDPRYTFNSRQEMIDYARAAVDRARAAVPQWFGIVPRADVVIQPYPEFQERSAPGGQYHAPSEDGTRPGIYVINTYQPERQSRAGLESTAFHETYPGHHLQIAIARERPGAHPFQRYFFSSGFGEGWALYSERLSDEMGLFSGDVDRMGLLSNEALRAARLVVDPGMHALGWTRQQAIDYLLANTTEAEAKAIAEIDRYIAVPGQATSYMLGSLEILRLREAARTALGPRFDIREFHDRVLEDGNVTLPMLRQKIEQWIAAR